MKINLKDIKIETRFPRTGRSIPVFELINPSFDRRRKSISILGDALGLRRLKKLDAKDSLHLVSERGQIQYYRPSGALWANNVALDAKYKDERRNWRVDETEDPEDPKASILMLNKNEQSKLETASKRLFTEAGLLSRESYFARVDLDQVAQLDEKGNEVAKFPGEATAKYLYQMEGISVDGPGAKTYAFYNPGRRMPEFKGAFHSWREIAGARKLRLPGIEETLDRTLCVDPELLLYKEKGFSFELNQLSLEYFSMPPFLHQKFLFPVIHVVGFASPKEQRSDGYEFAKYYHAIPPEYYARADMYADYLVLAL